MNSQITILENSSASATPASGELVVYAKSDGKLYYKNDAGTEVEVAGVSNLTALAVAFAIAL
jgi:hypothetical protein